jgi:hypothetical protein
MRAAGVIDALACRLDTRLPNRQCSGQAPSLDVFVSIRPLLLRSSV